MTTVIDLLEQIGADGRLRHLPQTEVARLLEERNVSVELRTALLSRKKNDVEELLGVPANVCCALGAEEDGEVAPTPQVN
jgi:hypothetical protein